MLVRHSCSGRGLVSGRGGRCAMIVSLRAISCPGLQGPGSVGVRTPASKAMPIDIAFVDWL
jgi:hypothetical protein